MAETTIALGSGTEAAWMDINVIAKVMLLPPSYPPSTEKLTKGTPATPGDPFIGGCANALNVAELGFCGVLTKMKDDRAWRILSRLSR
jgi:hypothetical protein